MHLEEAVRVAGAAKIGQADWSKLGFDRICSVLEVAAAILKQIQLFAASQVTMDLLLRMVC